MNFPKLSESERVGRLTPPNKKMKVILDTDTYNEVDDQFALAYMLLSEERIDLQAVYSAPFSAMFFEKLLNTGNIGIPMTNDLETGLEQSHNEILKIFKLLDMNPENKVYRGSKKYMKKPDEPVDSEAARDLVRRAMESEEILYVAAIGEITNIASAILMEPAIIRKIVVVWLGGQPLYWPHTVEFNLGQDLLASQTVFNSGVPLVLFPCMTVSSALATTSHELNAMLNGKSRIGTYLSEAVSSQLTGEAAQGMFNLLSLTYCAGLNDYELAGIASQGNMSPSRIIWDISVVGYLVNPNWCPSSLVETPYLTDDLKWRYDENRHLMRICNYIYRDAIFGDMFSKLADAPK